MSSIKYRTTTSDMAAVAAQKPAAWQVYQGPGVLLAAVLDRTDSSGLVTTIYDSARGSTSDPSIYAQTGDADLGTTVPVFFAGDADIVAGTSTAGVGHGLIFTDGLYLVNSGDTTDVSIVWKLFFKPLIKKSVNVVTTGSAGSATGAASIFTGPARWYGYSVTLDPQSPSTLDITFKDSGIATAGNTVMTKTNYVITPGTRTLRKVVTTTGEDEAGAAVTTGATGTYGTDGIFLTTGLNVNLAQGNAFGNAASFDCLFEA